MGIFKKKNPSYATKEGYKQKYNPKSSDARHNGYSPEHRDIAKKMIKRELADNEVVHHKDGNKLNNKKKNLKVMTKSEHYKVHKMWRWKKVKREKNSE